MKQVCVAVFDRAAQVYGKPVFVPARGIAVRSFTDEVNRDAPDNDLHRHPDDFDLYLLAEYDDSLGVFSGDDSYPVILVRGKDVISR